MYIIINMLFSILQNVLISILVIFLAHHLMIHLKDSYTIKKTKDFAELQSKKYKSILDEVNMINEKEKNELIQQIEETKSMVQNNPSIKDDNSSEDFAKNNLSETDLKQMNDDLDSFVQSHIMET